MEVKNYRSVVVDVMKGIGIILVVLGHTVHNSLSGWIYTFHMPLFFIVAGLFLKPGGDVYFKRIKSLLVPYFFFAVVTYLYWRFLEIKFRPLDEGFDANAHFFDIFLQTGEFKFDVVLWFLPCLFLSTILLNLILTATKNRVIIMFVCLLWIVAANLYIPDTEYRWLKETWCTLPFIAVGWLLGEYLPKIETKLINVPLYYKLLAILPLVAIIFLPHGGDIHSSTYPNGYAYFAIVAIICVIAVYVLSVLLIPQKWLSWLGRNTLVIMCLHDPLKRIVLKAFSFVIHQTTDELRESTIISIVVTAVVIAALVPVCMLVSKKAKWILGRF